MVNDDQSKLPVTSASATASSPSLRKCLRCKTPNTQDAIYCMQCGGLLGERKCNNCKTLNAQDAMYCKHCSKQLQQTLYNRFGPRANKIKIFLQMLVGVILTVVIIVYIAIYAI